MASSDAVLGYFELGHGALRAPPKDTASILHHHPH